MESLFGKKNKQPTQSSGTAFGGYIGKIKTGSSKTKDKSPKAKVVAQVGVTGEKKARKPKVKTTQVTSNETYTAETIRVATNNHDIPAWVKESSEQKISSKPRFTSTSESSESKLQWRKETKKSQRSFSKNKEKEYAIKSDGPKYVSESTRTVSEAKPSWKAQKEESDNWGEAKKEGGGTERKSSWNKTSIRPGTGFEKSKTGYKGIGSAWDKSSAPRVTTRKWDTDAEKIAKIKNEGKVGGYKGKNPTWEKEKRAGAPTQNEYTSPKREFPKPSFEKNTPSTPKQLDIKPKYIAPKPTWQKENEVVDKKKLIDPTK